MKKLLSHIHHQMPPNSSHGEIGHISNIPSHIPKSLSFSTLPTYLCQVGMINICPSPIHPLARMSITFAYNFCHFKHNGTFIYAISLPFKNTAQVLGYDSSISFHQYSLVAIYYKEFPGPAYIGTMNKNLHIRNRKQICHCTSITIT